MTAMSSAKPSLKLARSLTAHDPKTLVLECQEVLRYSFRDPKLLLGALTHASSSDTRIGSNERLEFLGDAILGVVICEHLFLLFPDLLEGALTKIKSEVVSRRTCARISRSLGLDRFLILGRGMASQGIIPASVMAAVLESLIAAIYLDGGLEAARRFILEQTRPEIEKAAGGHHGGNFKSALQQLAQKLYNQVPTYVTLGEEGPDHSKNFQIAAVIGDIHFPPAWGRNKKEAQQRAALNALSQINDSHSISVDSAELGPPGPRDGSRRRGPSD